MYIGEPQRVAAIISPGRNLAKPKSAKKRRKVEPLCTKKADLMLYFSTLTQYVAATCSNSDAGTVIGAAFKMSPPLLPEHRGPKNV